MYKNEEQIYMGGWRGGRGGIGSAAMFYVDGRRRIFGRQIRRRYLIDLKAMAMVDGALLYSPDFASGCSPCTAGGMTVLMAGRTSGRGERAQARSWRMAFDLSTNHLSGKAMAR